MNASQPHRTETTNKEEIVVVDEDENNNNSNKKRSAIDVSTSKARKQFVIVDRRKSSAAVEAMNECNIQQQPAQIIVKSNCPTNGDSSRTQPLNQRLRSVFDLVRHRLSSSASTSVNGVEYVDGKKAKSKANTQSSKKSAQKHLSVDFSNKNNQTNNGSNNNGNNKNKEIRVGGVLDEESILEICQLCYSPCYSSAHEAAMAKAAKEATAAADGDDNNNNNNSTSTSSSLPNYVYALETCEHAFCAHCLRQYLKYQIIEARVNISCPQCTEKMHPSDIYRLLQLKIDTPMPTTPPQLMSPSQPLPPPPPSPPPVGDDNGITTSALATQHRKSSSVSASSWSSPSPPSSLSPLSTNSLIAPANSANNNTTNNVTRKPESDTEWSQLIDKYEEFMLRRVLVSIPDTRFCPAPDCTYAVIASGCANCPQLHCMRPDCNTSFCYHCKQRWHPNLTCEDAALRAAASAAIGGGGMAAAAVIMSADTSVSQGGNANNGGSGNRFFLRSILGRSNSHLSTSSSIQAGPGMTFQSSNGNANGIFMSRNVNGDWVKEEIKRCPKCQALIVKMDDGSCNHITCSVCGCEFCWLCMKEISDLHYLSPSGCTFWGKKPWSRKKKIMWQLGTLVGAPVGIALIAGVAVPAILIGLPIWAGRKVYIRYKNIGKHKRNTIVVGTVFGTILVAPLVAALAVGIGVPILLAYVYGVVPISLCRSGGCGVTTNQNGGVRFAFDDEEPAAAAATTTAEPTTVAQTTTTVSDIWEARRDVPIISAIGIRLPQAPPAQVSNNSVTIPISAIDTATVIDRSPSSGSVDNNDDDDGNKVAGRSTTAAAASNNFTNSTNSTPLFVTITMGSKPNNTTTYVAGSSSSTHMIKGRHHQLIRSPPHTVATATASQRHNTKSRVNSCGNSNNNNNNKKPSWSTSSTKMINTSSILSSASIACGTVELDEIGSNHHHQHHNLLNRHSNHQTLNNSCNNMNSSSSSRHCHQSNTLSSRTANAATAAVTSTASSSSTTTTMTTTTAAAKSTSTAYKSVASETGTALNYLNANACHMNASDDSNSKKIICKSVNPSIGEMSLGEDLSLEDMDYMEDEQKSGKTTNSNYASQSNNNRVVKIIKKHLIVGGGSAVGVSYGGAEESGCGGGKKYPKSIGKNSISNESTTSSSSDRESASNRALAGDLASVVTTKKRSLSKGTVSVSVSAGATDDLKSTYTVSSYERAVAPVVAILPPPTAGVVVGVGAASQLHVSGVAASKDLDAYSVSIVSADLIDKSVNPSVTALVGSIKDNLSVSNLSA